MSAVAGVVRGAASAPVARPLRPALHLPFVDMAGLPAGLLEFSRPGADATYADATGVLLTVAADVARFDHHRLTGAARGLVIEESRTNLAQWSHDFADAAWFAAAGGTGTLPVRTANAGLAPDGTPTATRLRLDRGAGATSADFSHVQQAFSGLANPHTLARSVWMRSCDGNTYQVGLRSSTSGASVSATVTAQWQRFEFVTTTAAATDDLQIGLRGTVPSSQAADILVWGGQVEPGASVSSLIPTAGSPATRSAEVAAMALGSWFNPAEGTFLVEASRLSPAVGASGSACVLSLDDGTTANRLQIRVSAPGGGAAGGQFIFSSAGVTQANIATDANPVGTAVARYAAAYKAGSAALAVNGVLVGTAAPPLAPGPNTTLRLNGIAGVPGSEWAGHIRRVLYYPTRLSDAELRALTA